MTDYSATTLDVDELKQMARRAAANAMRTLNAPWTYTVKEYETVEKQHKAGGFLGFMQQTVTTTERVESSKETQILGEHWLLDQRSERRSFELGESREFGACWREVIETTWKYALLPNGELVRAALVTTTLVRFLRDNDFCVDSVEVSPFEEADFLELDTTPEEYELQIDPTQALTGNLRNGRITESQKGDGLKALLSFLMQKST